MFDDSCDKNGQMLKSYICIIQKFYDWVQTILPYSTKRTKQVPLTLRSTNIENGILFKHNIYVSGKP